MPSFRFTLKQNSHRYLLSSWRFIFFTSLHSCLFLLFKEFAKQSNISSGFWQSVLFCCHLTANFWLDETLFPRVMRLFGVLIGWKKLRIYEFFHAIDSVRKISQCMKEINYHYAKLCGDRTNTDRTVTFFIAAVMKTICFEKNASETSPPTCLFTFGKTFNWNISRNKFAFKKLFFVIKAAFTDKLLP